MGVLMQRTAMTAGAIVAALATGAVLAVSGGAQTPGGQTIRLIERSGADKFVDVPPRADSDSDAGAGDQFLFRSSLFNSANQRAGKLQVVCTFTKGGQKPSGVCEGVFALGGGDLLFSARLSRSSTVNGAITGGTGVYAGARGTFSSVDLPGEDGGDPSIDTITLLP